LTGRSPDDATVVTLGRRKAPRDGRGVNPVLFGDLYQTLLSNAEQVGGPEVDVGVGKPPREVWFVCQGLQHEDRILVGVRVRTDHAGCGVDPFVDLGFTLGDVRLDWFLVGIVSAVIYRILYDRDVGRTRRSRVRRWTLILGIWLGQLLLSLDDRAKSHSLGIGSSVGAVCYRAKYGLLNDLPED